MDQTTAKKLLKLNYDLYESQALSWDKTRQNIWEQPIFDFIKTIRPNSKILDLGCGNGRLLKQIINYSHIRKNMRIDYTGIDPTKRLIEMNQKKYNIRNNPRSNPFGSVFFKVGDGLNLKYKNRFDYVISIAVLHHIPSEKLQLQFLKNIHQSLNAGGQLLLTVWNRWQPRYQKYFIKKYKNDMIKMFPRESASLSALFREISFADLLVPWKQSGKFRFIHCFTAKELSLLAKQAGFKNIDVFYTNGGHSKALAKSGKYKKTTKEKGLNIYLLAKK